MSERKVADLTRALGIAVVVVAMVASSLAVVSGAGAGVASKAPSSTASAAPAASGCSVAINPSPAGIDLGQSLVLKANATLSCQPYKGYQWWEGTYQACPAPGNQPIVGATGKTYTASNLLSVGEYIFCVNVTDSETPPVNLTSVYDPVTVNPDVVTSTPTPSGPVIDSGQTVRLSEVAKYGTGKLTYQWYSGGATGCTSPFHNISGANSATYSPGPLNTTTSYCVVVGDASATPWAGMESNSTTVTVVPAVQAPAPTPRGDYGDKGQSFNLTASPSGGTGPGTYTLQWFSGTSNTTCNSGSGLGTGLVQTVAPTTTTYYCYKVNDASYNAPTAFSPATKVVINNTLTAGPIYPSSVSFDLGTTTPEVANLTAQGHNGSLTGPSGAHPTYRYQWRTGNYTQCAVDKAIAGAQHPWLDISSASFSTPSSVYYCMGVEDANNTWNYSSSIVVKANPALVPGPPSPQASQIDVGGSVQLKAPLPSGGTATFSWAWFKGTGCTNNVLSGTLIPGATGQNVTVAPGVNSTYFYRVTDSSYGVLELGQMSECSPVATVTVNPAMRPGPPTISVSTPIDNGQSVKLTRPNLPAGEGTPVVTYGWRSGSSPNCSNDSSLNGLSGTTYGPIVPSPGITYYCYQVSDGSFGAPVVVSTTVSVTVNSPPTAGTISSLGVPDIDQGPGGTSSSENVTLVDTTASGGTGTLSYQWYGGQSYSCSVLIAPAYLIPGATSFTYTVTGLNRTTEYCLQVTDQSTPHWVANTTGTAFQVQVLPPLVAGKPTASLTSLDLLQSLTLTAHPSGGYPLNDVAGVYQAYQWFTAAGPSCTGLGMIAGKTTSQPTITPTTPGTNYFCYRVTDYSNGNVVQESAYATAAVSVTVYSTLAIASPPSCVDYGNALWTGSSVSCSSKTPKVGDHVTIAAANVTGGNTSNYVYTWYYGPSSVCQTDTQTMSNRTSYVNVVVPSSQGTYYCFVVTDGAKNDTQTSLTFFLDPSSSSSGSTPAAVPMAVGRPV